MFELDISHNCNEDERVENLCGASNKLYLIFSPRLGAAQALETTDGVLEEKNSSLDFYSFSFF